MNCWSHWSENVTTNEQFSRQHFTTLESKYYIQNWRYLRYSDMVYLVPTWSPFSGPVTFVQRYMHVYMDQYYFVSFVINSGVFFYWLAWLCGSWDHQFQGKWNRSVSVVTSLSVQVILWLPMYLPVSQN